MRLHPDELADLRRIELTRQLQKNNMELARRNAPQQHPMNPWLFGSVGVGMVAAAIFLMAWGIPAAIRFVVSLLAVDLVL